MGNFDKSNIDYLHGEIAFKFFGIRMFFYYLDELAFKGEICNYPRTSVVS